MADSIGFDPSLFAQSNVTPQPTIGAQPVNINDSTINATANSFTNAEAQAKYLQGVYEAQKQYISSFDNPQPTPAPLAGASAGYVPTTQSEWDKWTQDIKNSISSLSQNAQNAVGPSTAYAADANYNIPSTSGGSNTAQSVPSMPSNYTGFWQGTPYQGGTVQTAGGGFTPDGSYSAGYHGSGGGGIGGPYDGGQWGTGKNMGPMVNGTIQTGGGGFTPDGTYSAGYHGSGEHPEISGNSTPGMYQSGSFGNIVNPELSNSAKVNDYINYLSQMGFDTSQINNPDAKNKIASDYSRTGEFNGMDFLKGLTNADPNKSALINQYAGNKMMPTSDVYGLLGGSNFSKLFAPATAVQYATMLNKSIPEGTSPEAVVSKIKSLKDIPQAIQQELFTNYVTPYASNYYNNDQEKLKNLFL